jgi:hypothetical protein
MNRTDRPIARCSYRPVAIVPVGTAGAFPARPVTCALRAADADRPLVLPRESGTRCRRPRGGARTCAIPGCERQPRSGSTRAPAHVRASRNRPRGRPRTSAFVIRSGSAGLCVQRTAGARGPRSGRVFPPNSNRHQRPDRTSALATIATTRSLSLPDKPSHAGPVLPSRQERAARRKRDCRGATLGRARTSATRDAGCRSTATSGDQRWVDTERGRTRGKPTGRISALPCGPATSTCHAYRPRKARGSRRITPAYVSTARA